MLKKDTMVDNNRQTPAKGTDTGASETDSSLGLSGDGMSTATARLAIDRKVRKKLLKDYDLLELGTRGVITPLRPIPRTGAGSLNY